MPKDPEGMAKAVIRILQDPQLSSLMVAGSQKRIDERYTIKHMADATIGVYQEVLDSRNILVIKLTALGDVVLITAALKALRATFPNARIHCLTSPEGSSVLQRCPYINNVIIFDGEHKNLKSEWELGRDLRGYRFDEVIDLQNNRFSHMIAFLSFAKTTIGYDNGKFAFLLSRRIKNDAPLLPPVEHQFRLLKTLGVNYDKNVRLELWPSQRDEEYVQTLLDGEWLGNVKDMVGINIAASARWSSKNWPIDHIVKLCDMLAAKNIRVFLTGQQKDKGAARLIVSRAKSKPVDFTGKTNIMQLAALLARAKVYISGDSAPLHVAAAMKVPVVGLFGPTDPSRHMPPADRGVVMREHLKCSPCYSGECKIKTHVCMKQITAEDVFAKVKELLK